MYIAVYAICKNEASMMERWLRAVQDADEIVILDTGSNDRTDEIIDRLRGEIGARLVYVRSAFDPFRFDDARNAALALVSPDADWCFAFDIDEIPDPGWRRAIEDADAEARARGITRMEHPFVSSHDADGKPGTTFLRRLIHRRTGYRWTGIVHETLAGAHPAVACDVVLHHWPDATKSRAQYLPALARAAADEPYNARSAFYHARELMYYHRHAEATTEFLRFLALPTATWSVERAEGYRFLARCTEDLAQREAYLLQATQTDPRRREHWVDLAQCLHNRREFARSLDAARHALAITERARDYINYPEAWGERAADLASVCAWFCGEHDAARDYLRAALALAPTHQRLRENAHHMGVELPDMPNA
jgi:tetratricopeptide (TPR) repeat protein